PPQAPHPPPASDETPHGSATPSRKPTTSTPSNGPSAATPNSSHPCTGSSSRSAHPTSSPFTRCPRTPRCSAANSPHRRATSTPNVAPPTRGPDTPPKPSPPNSRTGGSTSSRTTKRSRWPDGEANRHDRPHLRLPHRYRAGAQQKQSHPVALRMPLRQRDCRRRHQTPHRPHPFVRLYAPACHRTVPREDHPRRERLPPLDRRAQRRRLRP